MEVTAATQGSTNFPQWGLSWSYDRYGNRVSQALTAGSGPSNSLTVDATTNRVTGTGFSYDAAGNMTSDGLNTLAYDAENHLVTSTAGGASTYSYDGNGLRVKKVSGATSTVYIFSGAKVIDEYDGGAAVSAPTRENIYAGSDLLATVQGTAVNYYTRDHLSVRKTYDGAASLLGQQGHFPFGESWYAQGTSTKWQFTSYERDSESGNDYALARFNVNRLGRFSSPDPAGFGAVDSTNPQSWNRYTYVTDDPTDLIDPLGLCGGGPGLVTSTVGGQPAGDPTSFFSPSCQGTGFGGTGGFRRPLQYFFLDVGAGGPSSASSKAAKGACVTAFTAAGAVAGGSVGNGIGTFAGAVAGGTAGTFALPGGGTVGGAIVGGAGGGIAGTFIGAGLGSIGGYLLGNIVCSQSTGPSGGGSNQSENRKFAEAVRQIEKAIGRPLEGSETDWLHREISGMGYSLDEIIQIGIGWFGSHS